jgi:Reelin subrepeat B/Secretion system C-terminal sorting domain
MKYFLLVFIIAATVVKTNAQCNISGSAYPTVLCDGEQLILLSVGDCGGSAASDDFNTGGMNAMWSSSAANPVFTNPCPVGNTSGPNGFYLWVGTTASTTRTLVTNPFDVSMGGCSVDFWMRYGIEPSLANCEDPDAPTEGVHMQYSINGGTTWTDFASPDVEPVGNLVFNPPFTTVTKGTGGYWQPYSSLANQQTSELYYWNEYSCPIPNAAWTTTTQFRWAQLATSSIGYDAWGIDEVNIHCLSSNVSFAWITPATGDTVFHVQNPASFAISAPTSPSIITGGQDDTCWFVSVWDTLGYSATDTVCVTVETAPPIPIISQSWNMLISSSPINNQWYYNSSIIPGATNQTYIATQSGDYQVSVTNTCGTESSTYNFVVGVDEHSNKNRIQIYPNPNNGKFTVEGKEMQKIEIYDVSGRIIYQSDVDTEIVEIDLSAYSKGLYHVTITTETTLVTKDIVLE